MLEPFAQFQKLGQDNLDAVVKSLGAFTTNAQTIATEAAEYARKSLEQGSATVEKLLGAQSLDKAIEVQTDFLKTSYEGFVAQSTKLGELYTNLAKDAFRPYEGLVAKATSAAK